MGGSQNPLLAQAMSRADQGIDPLIQMAAQRAQADPGNPLLEQAAAMRQDGAGILQNPLLRAMQDDVQRRLFANQAARGKLGSGGTAEALQQSLIPMALNFREREIGGLTQLGTLTEDLRQRQLGNLSSIGGQRADLGQRSFANLMGLGTTLEDLRQREIQDLFTASGIGANAAARQGQAGLTSAANIGNLQTNIGQAQAQGAMGSALGNNLMLGGLIQGAQQFFQPTAAVPQNIGTGSFSFSPGGAGL